MIGNSQKYSFILFLLGIVCLFLTPLFFNDAWKHEAEWLLSLGLLLLFGQIVLFFILNRVWILSVIVAVHMVTIIYVFYAVLNDVISIFLHVFSSNYLLFSDVLLPLVTILLIYLTQRGPIFVNLKRNASAIISIISVSLIHAIYIGLASAVV